MYTYTHKHSHTDTHIHIYIYIYIYIHTPSNELWGQNINGLRWPLVTSNDFWGQNAIVYAGHRYHISIHAKNLVSVCIFQLWPLFDLQWVKVWSSNRQTEGQKDRKIYRYYLYIYRYMCMYRYIFISYKNVLWGKYSKQTFCGEER